VKPSFRILSGSRTGFIFTPPTDSFIAGRHPDAGLRFSPEHDLTVSTEHAQFACRDGVWYVRDLGSRNGTWVNGGRVEGMVPLKSGDHVGFGAGGPIAVFEPLVAEEPESTTRKLRALVAREKLRLRLVAGGLLALVLVFAGALVLADSQERSAWNADRSELQARIDSLIIAGRTTDASLATEVQGLRSALRDSEVRLQRLRTELASAGPGERATADLQRQLLSASTALQRQQHAASLDFQRIQSRNRRAVAMIWSEYGDGTVATGTAFAVRPDGTMLTNRHIVHGKDGGQAPRRIAIRFSDSDQAFPGRLLAVSETWDMAAIRVENVLGEVPVIARLNTRSDTLPAGSPLALIGFPLGGEPGASARPTGSVARPIVSAALIRTATPRTLELQGLGAAGGSGSPIMDAAGDVIGMLYGGRDEAGTQILVAVPAHALIAFLSSLR
jgi:S1-C subfamily serine protease